MWDNREISVELRPLDDHRRRMLDPTAARRFMTFWLEFVKVSVGKDTLAEKASIALFRKLLQIQDLALRRWPAVQAEVRV